MKKKENIEVTILRADNPASLSYYGDLTKEAIEAFLVENKIEINNRLAVITDTNRVYILPVKWEKKDEIVPFRIIHKNIKT